MDKLRLVLEQHGRWEPLRVYVDRIGAAREADFSNALENAKALLESIGKEICNAKSVALEPTSPIQGVLKKAFFALGYSGDDMVRQVSTALATIGQNVGELRNQISPTSHGRAMADLDGRNNGVDALTRDFLLDSTVVVAVFLIRAFEERQAQLGTQPLVDSAEGDSAKPRYEDNEVFNEFWDETFGEFKMRDYSFSASEILFALDLPAYEQERKWHAEEEEEEDDDDDAEPLEPSGSTV